MLMSRKLPQPPAFFLLCLLVGWGGRFVYPLPLGLPMHLRWSLAMLVLLSASMLEVWSFLTFRLKGTTSDPNGTASTLLVSGPFRFTRNPLYLSLSANLAWISTSRNWTNKSAISEPGF